MTHASLHSAKKYFDARGLVRTSDKADIDDVETIQMAKPLHVSGIQQAMIQAESHLHLL